MKTNHKDNVVLSIFSIFSICLVVRILEYLFIRTDQSFFAENFLHKLFGILVLVILIKQKNLTWTDIGFKNQSFLKNSFLGLFLGLFVFSIAYGYEFFTQLKFEPSIKWYVSAYSSTGNQGESTGFILFLMCILFNIVNVIMEEGIFRGLFITLAEKRTTFMKSNLIAAFLFSVWHVVMPLRSVIDGEMSISAGLAYALFYISTTFIMGFTIGLWRKMTGSLWVGSAEHFVNNTIVNLLHISTINGSDELLSIRLAIAQILFTIISIISYCLYKKRVKYTL